MLDVSIYQFWLEINIILANLTLTGSFHAISQQWMDQPNMTNVLLTNTNKTNIDKTKKIIKLRTNIVSQSLCLG